MPDTGYLSLWEPPAQRSTKRLLPGAVGAEGLPSPSRVGCVSAMARGAAAPPALPVETPGKGFAPGSAAEHHCWASRVSLHRGWGRQRRALASVRGGSVTGVWPRWGVLQWQAAAGGSVIDTATG